MSVRDSKHKNGGEEKTETDATTSRPSINLKYKSPYQNKSPVYFSYGKNNRWSISAPVTSFNVKSISTSEIEQNPSRFSPVTPMRNVEKASTKLSSLSLSPKFERKFIVKKSENSPIERNAVIPVYEMSMKSSQRKMLIINNIFSGKQNFRKGAGQDEKNLQSVFTGLGFQIVKHHDLKKEKLIKAIAKFRDELKISTDIMVLAVMSHGKQNNVVVNTSIETIDGNIDVEDILELFTNDKCKSMVGKPKIFIFQCCRGDHYQIQTDAQMITPKAPLTDTLIAYSTLPGFVSYRNPNSGSWYISTLCEVFAEYAHNHHVEDLLKIVDNKISDESRNPKQTTHFENRGFRKHCYLNPISK